jgi:hypothetical protein
LEFFRKFAEIFGSEGVPPLSRTLTENFATWTSCFVDTGGKFAAGVNNTGDKMPLVSTTSAANLPGPLVLLIPVANLLPVSTTTVTNCHWYRRHWRQICHQ